MFKFLTQSASIIVCLSATMANANELILHDDFDDGVLEPPWVINMNGPHPASGWDADESTTLASWLEVRDIFTDDLTGVLDWRSVWLEHDLPQLTDIDINWRIGWDTPPLPNDVNHQLLIYLEDAEGNIVIRGGMIDHWKIVAGAPDWRPCSGSCVHAYSSVGAVGTADIRMRRVGDQFMFDWVGSNGHEVHTTEFITTEPVVSMRFQISHFDRANTGEGGIADMGILRVDYIDIQGTPTDGTPPVADAGGNQAIHAGETVLLDGSDSLDDVTDSEDLEYSWTLTKPMNSSATLIDADQQHASFVADVPGTFGAVLTVTDEAANHSAPDFAQISSDNVAPEADAGDNIVAIVDTEVSFDGSHSADDDDDTLTFQWAIETVPSQNSAILLGAQTVSSWITPDAIGIYDISLKVNDGFVNSVPDHVTLTVISVVDYAQMELMAVNNALLALPDTAFDAGGHQSSLTNFVSQAIEFLQADNISQALNKVDELIRRTDGCELNGSPDTNGMGKDWIDNCLDQDALYPALIAIRGLILQL